MVFSSVSVMNYGAGVGFNNGLGGGVMVKTGVTQSGAHSQSALAVLGVATFVGAGTVVYSETAWNRNTALAAFYGGGGSLYLGTGVATIVNSVSMGVTATVIAAAAGGDHVVFGACVRVGKGSVDSGGGGMRVECLLASAARPIPKANHAFTSNQPTNQNSGLAHDGQLLVLQVGRHRRLLRPGVHARTHALA